VVLGASLGTTGTGWLVAVLGLKVNLGSYALPLVGAGAFMRLLARGRWRWLGLALAGFGLIFVGIDTLQDGMQELSGHVDFAGLPSGGAWGHLLAMAIGMGLTVLMQSSSAAVATTLTALHTGAVNIEQAAALVIGAAIGTTATGALAAIGGSVPARRTALAHVLFNLTTGLIALVLLPALLRGIRVAQAELDLNAGALALAAFHTTFIALGVAVFLPFVNAFARLIERLVPDKGPRLTRHLDTTLLQAPGVALEATRRALGDTAGEVFDALRDVLGGAAGSGDDFRRVQIHEALDQVQQFLATIPSEPEQERLAQSRMAQMHTIDHLMRLRSRLSPSGAVRRMLADPRLAPAAAHTRSLVELAEAGVRGRAPAAWLTLIEQHASNLAELRRNERLAVLRQTGGGWGPHEALQALDATRWFERAGYHSWRICHYLGSELRTLTGEAAQAERRDRPAP
ncbi:MAG TPA: Na/Pi symporter, partial [Egibacteraceae bacterium]|nr:Na/Pi symporter [Egibacteraceae bacterium]